MTARRVLGYGMRNVGRARWLLAYGAFFLLVAEGVLRFGGTTERAVVSLLSVVLLVIPLASLLLGAGYLYNNADFTRLLLAQPVPRGQLFLGLYGGLALPMALAGAVGLGFPLGLRVLGGAGELTAVLLLVGLSVLLTLVFLALAFLVAVGVGDRLKGLAAALLLWLVLAVLYDGIVLLFASAFSTYPIETPLLVAMFLNPVDLARVILLLQLDIAALMGYTGAVFERFFGGGLAPWMALGSLLLWIVAPLALALRSFSRKDL